MRLLFVEAGEGIGGSHICLYHLVKGLAARGHDCYVHFPRSHAWSERFAEAGATLLYGKSGPPPEPVAAGPADVAGGFKASRLYRTLSFYRRFSAVQAAGVARWDRCLDEIEPDIVQGNNSLPLNFDLAEAAARQRRTFVAHLRGFQPLHRPHRAYAGRWGAGIAVSRAMQEFYRDAGFDTATMPVIYDGIDMAAVSWHEPRVDVPADGGRILFLGRLVDWKGVPVLLEAFAKLRGRRPAATLRIVGDGPDRAALVARAAALGLGDSVAFDGYVTDTAAAMSEADLLVHCSTQPEPFGRVLVEAMAAGLPVIASRIGATGEIVEDGRTGLLTSPGNGRELAAALERLLAAGQGRVEMARSARRTVEERFDLASTIDRTAELFERIGPAQ